MNKKLLLLTLALLLVAGMVGAGTFAYFQDTEASTGNTFSAGTMDLKVMDINEGWGDGVTATWTLSNMKPGDSTSGWVVLDRKGTLEANHVKVTCDYTVTEEYPPLESDTDPNTDQHPDTMAKEIIITSAYYTGDGYNIDLLQGKNLSGGEVKDAWKVGDVDGDGKVTLYDLKNDPLNDLPPPDTFNYSFAMGLQLDPNAGNNFQGDTLNLTMIFTLNQDASQ